MDNIGKEILYYLSKNGNVIIPKDYIADKFGKIMFNIFDLRTELQLGFSFPIYDTTIEIWDERQNEKHYR